MEVINIDYEYHYPSSLIGNMYVPPYIIAGPINELYPVTNSESVEWKGRLNLMDETGKRINSLFDDLDRYIKNKNADYEFYPPSSS